MKNGSACLLSLTLAVPGLFAAKPAITSLPAPYPTVGSIERLDPALDDVLAPNSPIEKLADGFTWSEGPVWVPAEGALRFSDVP